MGALYMLLCLGNVIVVYTILFTSKQQKRWTLTIKVECMIGDNRRVASLHQNKLLLSTLYCTNTSQPFATASEIQ